MSIYFKETGNRKGKTIVFIHGGGISGWMWDKQLEYFKDYHCIIPDLPEHGKSINEGQISIKNSAYIIADIIRKYANGGKAHVVGHSLGAKIIIELLSINPEIIDHAVVASALFRPIPLMKFTHKPWVYRLSISMLKINWLMDLTVKLFKFNDIASNENLKKDFQSLTPDMLYRTYNELYQHLTLPNGLEKAEIPTLIIAGDREPSAMKQSVTDLANMLPNSKGILIKKGLHTYPWVMHDAFNDIINSWINDRPIDNKQIV